MEKSKILQSDILDIIFDGKNKEYGAYQLRKGYRKTLTKALVITGSFLVLVISGTVFAGLDDKNNDRRVDVLDTHLAEIKPDEPPPLPPTPPPPMPEIPPPDLNQVKYTPPVIVMDDEVPPETKIQEITDETTISEKTIISDNTVKIIQAPVEITNTQVVEPKKRDEENEIFVRVEKEAGFEGGDAAWRNYLQRNLNASTPIDNGAEPGKFTVIVKFVVSKDGSVSSVTCENDPGFGMCQEAVRVIKKTKNWIPAVQNGHNVNAYRRQPIVFVVD